MSDPTGPSREERLRQLLTDAVEPVEPAPGAEARLLAKLRVERDRPGVTQRLRWAGATLGAAAAIAGVVVVGVNVGGRSESSNSSSAARASAGGATSATAPEAGAASSAPTELNPVPPAGAAGSATSRDSQYSNAGSVPAPAGGAGADLAQPTAKAVQKVADLDGDGKADRLAISGSSLVAELSAGGHQTVVLPQVGPGARVLGIGSVATPSGTLTPVAFVRMNASGATVRDTLVVVFAGRLTVVQSGGRPVVLGVSTMQGYTCAGPLVITDASAAGYVISGDQLVARPNAVVSRAMSCY